MKKAALFKNVLIVILFCITLVTVILTGLQMPVPKTQAASSIQHVFIIMMENHNWNQIKGSSSAPYINKTLLPMGGHAEQYYNPPHIHPSLPNYLWLEAGTNFGILNDNDPAQEHQSTTNHLVTLLTKAGVTWKAYDEGISGNNCPLSNTGNFAIRHEPFSYFDDVTNNRSSSSQNCIQHIRPYTELAGDLTNSRVANYNFITPNVIDDMHDGTVQQGDTWLSKNVPTILNSQAYKTSGVLLITWDEGEGGDGPIGMIVLSPFAKKNYSNTIHYTHSSTLKTVEEIFGVSPLLGDAAHATDLSDFFTGGLTGGGITGSPSPSEITPTLFCLGASCTASPSPSAGVSGSPSNSPSNSPSASPAPSTSVTPGPKPCKGDNDNDKDSKNKCNNHKTKKHHHKNGAVSKSVQKLLEELIKLLNELFGLHLTLKDITGSVTPTPTISVTPSPSVGVSISPNPSGSSPQPSGTSPSPTSN